MVSRYQVEPGRVCLINYGPSTGEVVVIVDFVDSRTVLVTGETRKRCTMPLSRLQLTKHRLPILQGAKNKTVGVILTNLPLKKRNINTFAFNFILIYLKN